MLGGGGSVANALFHVYVCVRDYTLPLDHSLRSDICHLGLPWGYVGLRVAYV